MKRKKAGFITRIIITAVIVYALVNLALLRTQTERLLEQRDALIQEEEALQQSNAAYAYGIEHSEDPEMIEDFARSKLGLVRPGERVFLDISR